MKQHKDTKKLKKLFRQAKKDGEAKSLKEFAKTHELGQDWFDRKMIG